MTRSILRSVVIGTLSCVILLAYAALAPLAIANQKEVGGTPGITKTFEVLSVEGNQTVVKLPEGTREVTVADDFRFNVNGKALSVRELKPGMKGTATITTRTTVTPVTVTEVKSGTVMHASGSSIIVRTGDQVKMFTQGDIDKRGVKILRDGRSVPISDFRQGDIVTATIVTSLPPRVMTEKEVQATLPKTSAPPASTAAAAPASTAAGRALPMTASSRPLLALVGVLLLATGLALTIRRRFVR